MSIPREVRIRENIRIAVLGCLQSCSVESDHIGAVTRTVRAAVSATLPGAKSEFDSGKWDSEIKEVASQFYQKGAWPQKLAAKDTHHRSRVAVPVPTTAPVATPVTPPAQPQSTASASPKKGRKK